MSNPPKKLNTLQDLNSTYQQYLKMGGFKPRFGQYIFNIFQVEIDNSFFIEDTNEVYNLFFEFLTKRESNNK